MLGSLLVLSLLSSLPNLLQELETQERRWNSVRHQHDYKNPQFQDKIRQSLRDLHGNPSKFLKEIDSLSEDQRKQLVSDDPNDRTEAIDVLSAELKALIQDYWEFEIGSGFPYVKSELWSLAKYRLKTLLQPNLQLESGFSLFRHQDPSESRMLLACARETDEKRIKGGSPWQLLNSYSYAGIDLDLVKGSPTKALLWKCGETMSFSWKRHELPIEIPEAGSRLSYLPGQPTPKLNVLLSLGLVKSLGEGTLKWMQRFLKWKWGYDLVSSESIDLETGLRKLLPQSDWFINLIDIPDANHFKWSEAAHTYQRLQFKKSEAGKEIVLEILLPPVHSELEDLQGLYWTREQLAEALSESDRPIGILDLACFSDQTQQHWISAYSEAARLQSKKSFELPLVISSGRGQRAEQLSEIVLAMDLVMMTVDEIAKMTPLKSLKEKLREGSFLQKLLHFLKDPFSWMSESRPREPDFFQPSVTQLPPAIDHLEAWPSYYDVEVENANMGLRIYPPLIPSEFRRL